MDIYTLLKGIQKHNCNKISFDWYNCLVLMKTGSEIKIKETQSDVKWETKLLKNITLQQRKVRAIVWYRNTMDIK